jgi:carboxylesterase
MRIISSAEPFFFPGGPIGCVLVHGFTGTPKEMRLLGEHLHQQGYTVIGVRLAGHATDLENMIGSCAQDWLISLEDGYHMLRPHCENIFLLGLSMGGVLSLIQASRLPVDGVVAMSTPYNFPLEWANRMPWLLRLLSPFVRTLEKKAGFWFSPEMEESHVHYQKNPVRPAYELYQLLETMKVSLPKIKIPALVIHSKDDQKVTPKNAEYIYHHLGSDQKDLVWVDRANHVITRDGDVRRVFEPITRFIQMSTRIKEDR